MSEWDDARDNFLRRWSRRKQAAETQRSKEGQPCESASLEANAPAGSARHGSAESPAFDPAGLPPIESITAASDLRAFLAPGVPMELTRAALRRAWMTDPAIRDFVGIAENQWDFTAPEGVPGFGALKMTPHLRGLIRELVAGAADEAAPRIDRDWLSAAAEPRKQREITPAARDQTADAGARQAGGGDAGTSAAAPGPPIVQRGMETPAARRGREAGGGDRAVTPRRHGGGLPK